MSARSAWLLLGALVFGALPARAGFKEALDADAAQALTVEVPLVRDERARLVIGNDAILDDWKLTASPGLPETAATDRALLDRFALRPATPEEIADGKVQVTGIATRYTGPPGSKFRGDGRSVFLEDVVLRDAQSGKVLATYQVTEKGIRTGLFPAGQSEEQWHATGKERLSEALQDALASDYLSKNGVAANRWLAVIDTGAWEGHGDERTGLLVRGGDFLRLAHLNYFRNDPKALRELFSYAAQELEQGRPQPLPFQALYRELVRRKADEFASLYWSRVVHGSTTWDNVGLLESVDQGTLAAVDRAHPDYHPTAKNPASGFAHEGEQVMDGLYGRELKKLLEVAASPAEREALAAIDGPKLGRQLFREEMTRNALLHLGFEADDAEILIQDHGATLLGPKGLLEVVRSVGEEADETAHYALGANGATQDIERPARYDIFKGLAQIAAIATSDAPREEKLTRLTEALEPLGGAKPADRSRASALLRVCEPLFAQALADVPPEARAAKVSLWTDQAHRINAPVSAMTWASLQATSKQLARRFADGEDVTRLRAEFRSLERSLIRRGPQTPAAVALKLRRGELHSDRDGLLGLSAYSEDGVHLQELSDGKRDLLRITLQGDPLGTEGHYLLGYRGAGDPSFTEIAPARVENGVPVFEVPVGELTHSGIELWFRGAGTDRYFSNGGWNFGKGMELALGSPLVEAELALYADRTGKVRDSVSAEAKLAASRRVQPQGDHPEELPQDERLRERLRRPSDHRQARPEAVGR